MSHKKFLALCGFLFVCYFVSLFKFYRVDYFVPDHFLYASFAQKNFLAKDAFSTLFLFFAQFIPRYPTLMNELMLVLMSAALFQTLYFLKILPNKMRLFAVVATLSASYWYYIYGKLFYDIPFSFLTYAICLTLVGKIFHSQNKQSIEKYFFILFFMLGFCLSWKPYNIFSVVGLMLLMLCHDELSKKLSFIFSVHTVKTKTKFAWLISFSHRHLGKIFFLFLIGYLLGNYGFFISPSEMLTGLRAYPGKYDFWYFLFFDRRIIWDHITALPFHQSSLSVWFCVGVLFILPIWLRAWKYFCVNAFMTLNFFIFITKFSPGFPWHGFMFAWFVWTSAIFLLSEQKNFAAKKFLCAFCVLLVALQSYQNFFVYLPKEVAWANKTKTMVNELRQSENFIYNQLNQSIKKYGGSYDVHCDVKRDIYLNQRRYFSFITDEKKWTPILNSKRRKGFNIYTQKNPADVLYIIRPRSADLPIMKSVMPQLTYSNFILKEQHQNGLVTVKIYQRKK